MLRPFCLPHISECVTCGLWASWGKSSGSHIRQMLMISVRLSIHTWIFDLQLELHFSTKWESLLHLTLLFNSSYIVFSIAYLDCIRARLTEDSCELCAISPVCVRALASVMRSWCNLASTTELYCMWRGEQACKMEGLKDWERQEERGGAGRRSLHSYWIHKGWKGPWQES